MLDAPQPGEILYHPGLFQDSTPLIKSANAQALELDNGIGRGLLLDIAAVEGPIGELTKLVGVLRPDYLEPGSSLFVNIHGLRSRLSELADAQQVADKHVDMMWCSRFVVEGGQGLWLYGQQNTKIGLNLGDALEINNQLPEEQRLAHTVCSRTPGVRVSYVFMESGTLS